jgi:hypothetical protein
MIEGKPFYAHKVIVAQLSEKYRAMFSTGMRESSAGQGEVPVTVNIENIPYDIFKQIMYYLYTGEFILD